jgi:hypothetical protein
MTEPVRSEVAECDDCNYRDDARGARGRGAQHAKTKGHRVTTTLTTVWPRAAAHPDQTSMPIVDTRWAFAPKR